MFEEIPLLSSSWARASSSLLFCYCQTLLLHDMYERCWNKPVLVNTFYDKCNIFTMLLLTMLEEERKWKRNFKGKVSRIFLQDMISYYSLLENRSSEMQDKWGSRRVVTEKWDVFSISRHVQFNSRIVWEIRIPQMIIIIRMQLRLVIEITCRGSKKRTTIVDCCSKFLPRYPMMKSSSWKIERKIQ